MSRHECAFCEKRRYFLGIVGNYCSRFPRKKRSPDSLVNVMNLRSDYNSASVTYLHVEPNVASDTNVGLYFQFRMFEEHFPWHSVCIQYFCDLGHGGCGDCYRVHACANPIGLMTLFCISNLMYHYRPFPMFRIFFWNIIRISF